MNEGGSFLLNGSHDAETTLDSFGTGAGFGNLSGIGEEDEEEDLDDRDMANLLNGLSDSCIGGRPPSSMTDSISSILPSSLTSSTRHALSKSQKGPPDVAESLSASTSSSVTIMDNNENDERSLLACSTASYRTHRDSPARPRMVSIQAERFALGAGEAEQTPMKGRLSFGSDASNLSGESRRSSGGSSAAESSSGDVRDMLKGWSGSGDLSLTDLWVLVFRCARAGISNSLYSAQLRSTTSLASQRHLGCRDSHLRARPRLPHSPRQDFCSPSS